VTGEKLEEARSWLDRALASCRFLAAIGALAALALAALSFCWAVAKLVRFGVSLVTAGGSDEVDLVKLFESADTILIGTVLLILGLGLWELFIGDLDLPPALTATSFDELKRKVASTLLLVLVVRFLESLVSRPTGDDLLDLGIAVTLVGGLLVVYANWRKP
jgi:uncharacterized membrane protein YqhA